MGPIITLALKDLRILIRDRFGLFWVLAFPFLFALFFGIIFSGDGGSSAISVAVVDEDSTSASQNFIGELKKSESLSILMTDKDDAVGRVRKGKTAAYIILKKGFGESEAFPFGGNIPIEVGMDPSRKAEAGFLQGILTQKLYSAAFSRYASPDSALKIVKKKRLSLKESSGLDTKQQGLLDSLFGDLEYFLSNVDSSVYAQGPMAEMGSVPVEDVETSIDDSPKNSFEIFFPAAILWGLIGCASAFAILVVKERTSGTLIRLKIAPISLGQILGGKGLATFITAVSVSLLLLIVGNLFFGVRLNHPSKILLAAVFNGFCFMGIMMLVSVFGKTERAVSGAGWGIFIVFAMIGGAMVPLMFLPKWLQLLSNISPVKWGILAFEGAIWRNFSFGEMLLPLGVLFGIGVVSFLIGLTVFLRTDR